MRSKLSPFLKATASFQSFDSDSAFILREALRGRTSLLLKLAFHVPLTRWKSWKVEGVYAYPVFSKRSAIQILITA